MEHHTAACCSPNPEVRPLPLRQTTEPVPFEASLHPACQIDHSRRRSAYGLGVRPSSGVRARARHGPAASESQPAFIALTPISGVGSAPRDSSKYTRPESALVQAPLTPPITPIITQDKLAADPQQSAAPTVFDFSRVDYELDRAQRIGEGLWSTVYLAEPVVKSPRPASSPVWTPALSPQQSATTPACRMFAIKTPSRADAKAVFAHEADMVTRLQQNPNAHEHIVSFLGIDPRNSSLVFEGVIGGSLEDLSGRLKVMTELARHLEVRQLFPALALDLISGLRFIHAAGVIHADIKPGNVLLDIVEDRANSPGLRARYIDFSASFVTESGSTAYAGGTWDYMAAEQLRVQKDLNEPTFSSDIWSLGITLLSVIVGGSPYAAACGSNVFMLREAVKSGDPLGFARMDPVVQKRMAACQDFVDCCRLALQKDRERRCTANAWEAWLEQQSMGQDVRDLRRAI